MNKNLYFARSILNTKIKRTETLVKLSWIILHADKNKKSQVVCNSFIRRPSGDGLKKRMGFVFFKLIQCPDRCRQTVIVCQWLESFRRFPVSTLPESSSLLHASWLSCAKWNNTASPFYSYLLRKSSTSEYSTETIRKNTRCYFTNLNNIL